MHGVPVNHRLSQMGGRGSGHDAVSDEPVHSLKPGEIMQQSIQNASFSCKLPWKITLAINRAN
jgi:hypothetical protein